LNNFLVKHKIGLLLEQHWGRVDEHKFLLEDEKDYFLTILIFYNTSSICVLYAPFGAFASSTRMENFSGKQLTRICLQRKWEIKI
jgi:hypothetical protein